MDLLPSSPDTESCRFVFEQNPAQALTVLDPNCRR